MLSHSLCCPEFVPQMTGAVFPEFPEMESESVTHCPALKLAVRTAAVVVASTVP